MVADGFSQVYKTEYTKTFVPTIKWELLRIFLAIAAMLEMILLSIDVISAYLKSLLGYDEYHPIYIKIAQRCKASQKDLIYKILKSLYRLKQVIKL